MLEHPGDIESMLWAMNFMERLVHTGPAKEYYGPLLQPAPGVDWAGFARSTYDSYHHGVGTCKMGNAPANSVVNAWGRSHDIPNLYIFDGSIWPTSSGMNPTATIAALSLRCADHLVRERANQETPA